MSYPCAFFIALCASSLSLPYLVSLFKVTSIVGSSTLIFSGINIVGPLCGAWLSVPALCLFFGVRLFSRFFMSGFMLTPLVYHIPTFCAAVVYKSNDSWLKSFIIGICFVFFLSHQHGASAWWFSLYWLIPLLISFFRLTGQFWIALSSTFVAHAVGSVIWLYWLNLTPDIFLKVMPIVPLERLLYASGMVIIGTLVQIIGAYSQALSKKAKHVEQCLL